MIPALGFMIAAYCAVRLVNTSVLTGDNYREVRAVLALVAVAIIVWAAWRIEDLGANINL